MESYLITIMILIIAVAVLIVFKPEITSFYVGILSRLFPQYDFASDVPAGNSKISLVLLWVLIINVLIRFIVIPIYEEFLYRTSKKKEAEYNAEQKERLASFLQTYSLDEKRFNELLKDVKIEILPEPVKDNFYHHRCSTDDKSRWGVYVGCFFLRCDYTLQTIRLVEALRDCGVMIPIDDTCPLRLKANS